MKRYTVMWSIDIEDEDINTPEEAAKDCEYRIPKGNGWVWVVKDLDTGKKYEVDTEYNETNEVN